jgi:hypothetical protein
MVSLDLGKNHKTINQPDKHSLRKIKLIYNNILKSNNPRYGNHSIHSKQRYQSIRSVIQQSRAETSIHNDESPYTRNPEKYGEAKRHSSHDGANMPPRHNIGEMS